MATKLFDHLKTIKDTLVLYYPNCQIAWEVVSNKNDQTSYPLVEVDILRISDGNLSTSNITTASISLGIYERSPHSKYSFDGMGQKLMAHNKLKGVLDIASNYLKDYVAVSNIETRYLETLQDGEAGSFSTPVIHVGYTFDMQFKEYQPLEVPGADFTNGDNSGLLATMSLV